MTSGLSKLAAIVVLSACLFSSRDSAAITVTIPRTLTAQGAAFAMSFDVPALERDVPAARTDFTEEVVNFRGYYDPGTPFRFEEYDVIVHGFTFSWNGRTLHWLGTSAVAFGIAELEHFPITVEFREGSSRIGLYTDLGEPDAATVGQRSFIYGERDRALDAPGALWLLVTVGLAWQGARMSGGWRRPRR